MQQVWRAARREGRPSRLAGRRLGALDPRVGKRLLRLALSLGFALVAGCANYSAEQCSSANWYSIGQQDAYLYGLQPQIHAIEYKCQEFGVRVPEQEYMNGWRAGDRERAMRMQKAM